MKTYLTLLVSAVLVLLLATGCAPTADPPGTTPGVQGHQAGFWKGLWHGFIMLFTFFVSLFNNSVGVYETHNSGNLYNLGFVLGAMIFFGCGGGGTCKKGK